MPPAALLVIDVQEGFDDPSWGPRNNPDAEQNIAKLLAAWRAAGRPVFHAQHMSTEPGSTLRPGQRGNTIKAAAAPLLGEPVIQKRVNSCFIGTGLEEQLRQAGISSLVLVGITTNHCVSTTARMAGNLGFEVVVVSDATATFDRRGPDGTFYPASLMHAVGLAELHQEFAAILSTASILASLS